MRQFLCTLWAVSCLLYHTLAVCLPGNLAVGSAQLPTNDRTNTLYTVYNSDCDEHMIHYFGPATRIKTLEVVCRSGLPFTCASAYPPITKYADITAKNNSGLIYNCHETNTPRPTCLSKRTGKPDKIAGWQFIEATTTITLEAKIFAVAARADSVCKSGELAIGSQQRNGTNSMYAIYTPSCSLYTKHYTGDVPSMPWLKDICTTGFFTCSLGNNRKFQKYIDTTAKNSTGLVYNCREANKQSCSGSSSSSDDITACCAPGERYKPFPKQKLVEER
ncbi:hypothetical protein BT63DRAFT_416101 [Microthyrium microscopicum]|uniref:Ig-like domain-containing protein n=1 Tax=Microthyrium microscopicum TaxID=703497 RepID=A0A6A6U7G1_9PEZI|nr:hypothetical protein BT63DRAFT_416101 [Microthyrium microscopicum]